MLANSANWKDIQKYYQGTFVKFRELGDLAPVYIDKVTSDAVWGVLHNGEKVELQLCLAGYELDYCIPKKTVYQNGEYAYILERIPARQWKKGLSEQNTSVSIISETGEFSPTMFRMVDIYTFVNKPQYRKLSDLSNGCRSVALNNRFYAVQNGFIYSDTHCLGVWDKKNKIHFHKPFEDEFTQLFLGESYNLIGV